MIHIKEECAETAGILAGLKESTMELIAVKLITRALALKS